MIAVARSSGSAESPALSSAHHDEQRHSLPPCPGLDRVTPGDAAAPDPRPIAMPPLRCVDARGCRCPDRAPWSRRQPRSEEHTSELQSLMRISYAVFCLKKKNKKNQT